MSDIQTLWQNYECLPMPFGHRGLSIDGSTLTLIQSDIGSCIITYLANSGRLSHPKKELLKGSTQKLNQLFEQCTPEGKQHFTKLKTLAEMVIKQIE